MYKYFASMPGSVQQLFSPKVSQVLSKIFNTRENLLQHEFNTRETTWRQWVTSLTRSCGWCVITRPETCFDGVMRNWKWHPHQLIWSRIHTLESSLLRKVSETILIGQVSRLWSLATFQKSSLVHLQTLQSIGVYYKGVSKELLVASSQYFCGSEGWGWGLYPLYPQRI